MIDIYKFHDGTISNTGIDTLSSQSHVWADLINPTQEEVKQIALKAGIPLIDLKETLDKEERPKVIDLDHYSLIIFRAPFFNNGEVSTTPVSIFLSKNKNNVITIRLKEIKSIRKIKEELANNKTAIFEKGLSYFVYRLLDVILESYFRILDYVEETIDKIEDRVLERPDKKVVEQIFETKKILIYFHKALTANREVISYIEKEYSPHVNKRDIKQFKILYNDVIQLIDMESTYRDILTGSLDIYLSSVSNNLNIIIKKMTAMASFILIPTLISGIYGMNFKWLPELGWKYGYFFSLGLMVFSVMLMYFYFKKKGWI
ncbi:MAG: magnesium/cobalt transporter CorA [Candidatus Woesearchaeota archaeon]|jgi:magnesium transporter|nr:magnesium/cobalt transporter CorA [Candidatus Woesearchaeota archaeon]MDP7457442.1 magnesium/cobalt transporter CorA [Candidatus Woesearchaeota archaeon]